MEFIVSLWEKLWASSNPRMHLFFAFSILHSHRSTLLSLTAFDETLRFVNDLSGNINVIESLARARLTLDFFRLEIAKDIETAATCCTEEELEALRTWQLDATLV